MPIDPISAIIQIGTTAINRIWPDPVKQAEEQRKLAELAQNATLAELEAHVQLLLAQIEVNKIEAQSKSMFVAGWRPAVGWVCVSILAYNYIGTHIFDYLAVYNNLPPMPDRLDMSELWPVLLGMLGIGGMRSFDKRHGNETNTLG